MARTSNFLSTKSINTPIPSPCTESKPFKFPPRTFKIEAASSRKNDDLILRRGSRTPRRLISISTSDGRWHGRWTSDYVYSLEELKLADLAEDGQKNAEVLISLNIDKHASFGFSVNGRIVTSFISKCSCCSSLYCREIDTSFDVWLLPSSRDNRSIQLPEIGGDDPSVIYVKPGCEADLDSLIRDTIRLTTSVKDTCSESCEKSEPKWRYTGAREAPIDGRWSRLLELRKAL
ncbi:PREDICTED: uncharacterized protein LOC104611776 [Nelumbo nucifera]|uniref:Uncharacterized protein LOC104611776 n=1 Tax=Nelumbo nucifera TaxID=4432 RepID=A0A1U8B877_NELNU|nr:PREDICTED: uncharacterized protein LOC104611776 [Nelumbo nucifera]